MQLCLSYKDQLVHGSFSEKNVKITKYFQFYFSMLVDLDINVKSVAKAKFQIKTFTENVFLLFFSFNDLIF